MQYILKSVIDKDFDGLYSNFINVFDKIAEYALEEGVDNYSFIGTVKYVGNVNEYNDYLTFGKIYKVIEIDDDMLRIVDDKGSLEYLAEDTAKFNIEIGLEVKPFKDGHLYQYSNDYWEIIEDSFNILKRN